MDPISIEKIRAMKRYKESKRQQTTFTHYMVATSVLCFLLSSPIWVPRVCSLLNLFLLTTLPDMAMAFLSSPKCLFVVGNLIVAFLVGESRLAPRATTPSPGHEVYEEYVKRYTKTSVREATSTMLVLDHLGGLDGGGEEEEEEEEEGGEEEEEELHRRVEDFIARVKKQRKQEAHLLLCYY